MLSRFCLSLLHSHHSTCYLSYPAYERACKMKSVCCHLPTCQRGEWRTYCSHGHILLRLGQLSSFHTFPRRGESVWNVETIWAFPTSLTSLGSDNSWKYPELRESLCVCAFTIQPVIHTHTSKAISDSLNSSCSLALYNFRKSIVNRDSKNNGWMATGV